MPPPDLWCWFGVAAGLGGCTTATPGPRDALDAFATATARADGKAASGHVSTAAQREAGALAPRLERDAPLLSRRAAALAGGASRVEERAAVTLAGGATAELVREEGGWRIRRVAGWPGGAATPEGVLTELRVAVASRDHGALLRVLTRQSARALERDLDGLVQGLTDLEGVRVEVDGDHAVVTVPGGRRVRLEREDGVWKVRAVE